jgi:hypothetical protein
MKYFNAFIVAFFIFFLAFNMCFAADDNTKFTIGASRELVDVTKLYVVNGEGEYSQYKALKGYPGENKFQVYFQGDTFASNITYKDLRGINLDEIIEWELDGKKVRHLRKDIYTMFYHSIKLYSRKLDYTGQFSQEWNRKTFGRIYEEWMEGMGFSQDAHTLLSHYFDYKYPVKSFDRFEAADIKVENQHDKDGNEDLDGVKSIRNLLWPLK